MPKGKKRVGTKKGKKGKKEGLGRERCHKKTKGHEREDKKKSVSTIAMCGARAPATLARTIQAAPKSSAAAVASRGRTGGTGKTADSGRTRTTEESDKAHAAAAGPQLAPVASATDKRAHSAAGAAALGILSAAADNSCEASLAAVSALHPKAADSDKQRDRPRIGSGTAASGASSAQAWGNGGSQLAALVTSRPRSSYSSGVAPPRPGSTAPTRGLDTVEHHLIRAAELLIDADYVLVAAGAGFSADSGLKVYKDIADVDAYKRLQLTYADLCSPDWLQRDPEIFFGFWGSCFNDYQKTSPHNGYKICKEWNDTCFHAFTAAALRHTAPLTTSVVAGRLQRLTLNDGDGADGGGGERVGSMARSAGGVRLVSARTRWGTASLSGAPEKKCEVFVYTSNVDTAFERVGFSRDQVLEIHGNAFTWQCAKPDRCIDTTWRLPDTHHFHVDQQRMRAPRWALVPVMSAQEKAGRHIALPKLACTPNNEGKLHQTSSHTSAHTSLHSHTSCLQQDEAEEAESARSTQRSHAATSTLSGGGIRAVRGLASEQRQEQQSPRPWPSRPIERPFSASSSASSASASSASASSSCPSSTASNCGSPGAGDGTSGGGGGRGGGGRGFSLSAYAQSPMLARAPRQVSAAVRPCTSSHPHAPAVNEEVPTEKVLNHVRCQGCGRAARPNVLMFDDDDWVSVEAKHYKKFAKRALSDCKEKGAKIVILEGGCGKRVPTVRNNSENLMCHGAQMIRINLDFPSCSKHSSKTVSLKMNVLGALEGIDMAIRRLRSIS